MTCHDVPGSPAGALGAKVILPLSNLISRIKFSPLNRYELMLPNCLTNSSPNEPGGQAASVVGPGTMVNWLPLTVYFPTTRLQSAVLEAVPSARNSIKYLLGSSAVVRLPTFIRVVV